MSRRIRRSGKLRVRRAVLCSLRGRSLMIIGNGSWLRIVRTICIKNTIEIDVYDRTFFKMI